MATNFFNPDDEKKTEFIPPDYSETTHPTEDDDDDDDFDDIDEDEEDDDEEIQSLLEKQEEQQKKQMNSTPFGNPQPQPTTPTWGTNPGNTSSPWWESKPTTPNTLGWSQRGTGMNTWGGVGTTSSTGWGTNQQPARTPLDRTKKVIFIDFLDAIVETYQSNGNPGLLPRDIYDIKPRFEVWTRLGAFNPDRVYMLIPINLINMTANCTEIFNSIITYFGASLASFMRIPTQSVLAICQNRVGQPKEELIGSVLSLGISKELTVLIGTRSGLYAQNNGDQMAAQNCGIDYYDLNQLLQNMY